MPFSPRWLASLLSTRSLIRLMRIPWLVAASFLCLPITLANLINVTIDDRFGDEKTGTKIIYSPPDAWNMGEQCSGCTARPDSTQAYMGTSPDLKNDHCIWTSSVKILGTWHDGTFVRSAVSLIDRSVLMRLYYERTVTQGAMNFPIRSCLRQWLFMVCLIIFPENWYFYHYIGSAVYVYCILSESQMDPR